MLELGGRYDERRFCAFCGHSVFSLISIRSPYSNGHVIAVNGYIISKSLTHPSDGLTATLAGNGSTCSGGCRFPILTPVQRPCWSETKR